MWRIIEDYPNYLVSNTGKIWSLRTDKELQKPLDRYGYERVTLHNENGQRATLVHRIVANAFIPNPENKKTINHIDCNKTNNSVENLEWATDSEQMRHAYDNGLFESCNRHKYDRHPPIRCIETGEVFISQRELARHLNVNEICICLALKGKIRHAGGYHFEYVC